MEERWRDPDRPRTESTLQVLKRGFYVWSNNLGIAAPFLMQLVLTVTWTAALLALLVLAAPPPESLLTLQGATDPLALQDALQSYLRGAVPLLVALVPLWFAGTLLITAYFDAGAIGMSIEANELYRSSVQDAFRYGRKHVFSMFLADLLMLAAVAAAAAAFAIPAAASGIPLIAAGAALPVLALGFLFLPVRYALVTDDLGPVAAVKRGVSFATTHPGAVLLLFLATLLISWTVSVPGQIVAAGGDPAGTIYSQLYSSGVQVLFLGPFTTVLWTRLYLNRTGKRIVENG